MDARIVFFGTPAFAVPVLDALVGAEYSVAGVVTAPDKLVGRKQVLTPPPAKEWAQEHGIVVLQPKKLDADFLAELQALKPDIGLIAAYGRIIPRAVLETFPRGVLNVHPSLLPRWRGPAPVQGAIAAGDGKTGVSVMLTDEQMDHGPVLVQKEISLSGNEKGGELTARLFREGAELAVDVVPLLLESKIVPKEQDHSKATFTKILTRESGKIDWSLDAVVIERLARAYDPWPGTYTTMPDGTRLKVIEASVKEAGQGALGTVLRDGFSVVCAGGTLSLDFVQPEGKKPMTGEDFLRGHRELIGRQLS